MRVLEQAWLPTSALDDPAFVQRLEGPLRDWSLRWFGHGKSPRLEREKSCHSLDSLHDSSDWRSYAPGIWLAWDDQTALGLARQALALGDKPPKMTTDDERLLLRLADRIGREMAQALGARLDSPREAIGSGTGVEFALFSGKCTLRLVIAKAALIRLRLRLCKPWKPPTTQSLASPSAALAEVPVGIDASLGKAQLSALELQHLAVGDVIVLDHAQDRPLLLLASDTGALVGRVKLAQADHALILIAS